MKDVCQFIQGDDDGAIVYYHFVYENGLRNLQQPFSHFHYRLILVAKGEGVLKTRGKEYLLAPGTLFFAFPYQPYEIRSEDKFAFLYISFEGARAERLLERFRVSEERMYFPEFGHVYDFWMSAIQRIYPENAGAVTESVFMYTLSFLTEREADKEPRSQPDRFESVIEYIERNFADPDLCLGRVADLFFYNEKYLSSLFAKRMEMKFTDYLNTLRITRAKALLRESEKPLAEIAKASGYSDPFYFSKVFKKLVRETPSEYRRKKREVDKK